MTKIDQQPNTNSAMLPAIALAVWMAVLVVAFLANRASDVGQLPRLIGGIADGPLAGAGMMDSLAGVVIACLIAAAWYGIGGAALRMIGPYLARNLQLDLALRTAIGAAIGSLAWFFLGLVRAYSGIAAVIVVAVGIAFAIARWFSTVQKFDAALPEPKATAIHRVLQGLLAAIGFLTLIAAVAPPTAKDTLLYHFSVPKMFIQQGSNAFIEGNIASYLSLGTEMHTVWAMLLGGFVSERAAEAAAGATILLFFPLLLIAVYGWMSEIGASKTSGLIAALIVASVPTAFQVASSGYIDIALAFYVTLAVYALSKWWRSGERGWLGLIAIFLGAALSIKLTAVFVFAAFALLILLRARNAAEDAGRIAVGGFAALLLAGFIASPWHLRTWYQTGSPVFPFYMSIWKGEAPGWDVERSNLFQTINSEYGGSNKTAVDYLTTPWRLSVAADREIPRLFDGVLGLSFLFGLPILIVGLWEFDLPLEAKLAAAVAGIVFAFWLFSSQQLRYLLPVVPLLALAICAATERLSPSGKNLGWVLRYGTIAVCLAGLLVSIAWFFEKAPLRVVLGGETRDSYLTRNLDYYPFYETVNADADPAAKVWLINMRRDTYHLDKPVVSDYMFEDWTLRKIVWEARSAQELKAKAAALGIKYILTRHDFLFDYDRSTLVDDKKPRAENEGKLQMARELILDKANTVRSNEKFSLVKVF